MVTGIITVPRIITRSGVAQDIQLGHGLLFEHCKSKAFGQMKRKHILYVLHTDKDHVPFPIEANSVNKVDSGIRLWTS